MHFAKVIMINLKNAATRTVTALLFGTVFFSALLFLQPRYFTVFLIFIMLFCLVEWCKLVSYKTAMFWLLTPVYIILPYTCMIALNVTYRPILVMLFISVFVFDSAAYVVGSLFGKHKIYPPISPNKSWEGFIGGFASLYSCLLIVHYFLHQQWDAALLFIIALVTAIVAVAGDFFESYFKRRARVKDSGDLLPGHGGFLDRFDASMFVAPLFYIVRHLLHRLF